MNLDVEVPQFDTDLFGNRDDLLKEIRKDSAFSRLIKKFIEADLSVQD